MQLDKPQGSTSSACDRQRKADNRHREKYIADRQTDLSRHRTNDWYSHYQALVRSVPDLGTTSTNEW
ncbi:MAG: hypothetical protein SPI30_00450 [Prevotella sp.]|nr:hypothetical protein [Prevotella sp.]